MELDALRNLVEQVESGIAGGPIVPTVTAEEIRAHLDSRYNFTTPLGLDEITADVQRMLQSWQVQVTHPRYLGLFNPSVTFASIVGDFMAAAYNPQLATWRTSPGPNEIERHTLAWLKRKFGFPADAAANFTSGGAEANLSAVIVALTQAFPEYSGYGLRRLSFSPTLYVTAETHVSFNKIAHMTGLGRRAVRIVATDSRLKMDIGDLARRIAEDRKSGCAPFMVVGTAGTTAAGVIDPLPQLARFCRAENLWLHVDAAWGGAALLSPQLRSYFEGIDGADSITCDAHKWFSVPMGAGMFFCRHPEAVSQAFRVETSVMPGKTAGSVDPYTTSVQWSRRFIGLKLFLALAHHGEQGYVELIEHQARMGDILRQLLKNNGWSVLNETPLPVVCFTRPGLDIPSFLAALYRRQIAWMSEVQFSNGIRAVRACITSFRTTQADIEWVLAEMDRLLPKF
jgi:glutamate/tyrosine decarboxylase-like PLP-dependent enzyme